MGPNDLPMVLVPNFWMKKRRVMIMSAMGTTGILGFRIRRPSTAETMVMAGVMILSASKVHPPIIAKIKAHEALFLISAKSAKIPPSPLLSALNAKMIYFMVV